MLSLPLMSEEGLSSLANDLRTHQDKQPWGPFLESPGNLPGQISVFGGKCFLVGR